MYIRVSSIIENKKKEKIVHTRGLSCETIYLTVHGEPVNIERTA
jgi:hypothetical protein